MKSVEKSRLPDEWYSFARHIGYPYAATVAEKSGEMRGIVFAEIIISYVVGRIAANECVLFSVAEVDDSEEEEVGPDEKYNDNWLLGDKPEGTVLPPASGRAQSQTPNLLSANPSFAALLIKHIRDKFNGDAPVVYQAAHISRKTYSAIVCNELRPVSREVAISLALALHLTLSEASEFLCAAGYAFSHFTLSDVIYQTCIVTGIYDIERINEILISHGAKPLSNHRSLGKNEAKKGSEDIDVIPF